MSILQNVLRIRGEKFNMGKKSKTINGSGLEIAEIEPLTAQQVVAFESNKHLVLYGCAGTGKTFVGCYLCLLYTSPSPRDS